MRLVVSCGHRPRRRPGRPTWSGFVLRPRWTGRRAILIEGWPVRLLVRGRITVNQRLGIVQSSNVEASIDHGVTWTVAPEWAEDLAVKQAVRDAARSRR